MLDILAKGFNNAKAALTGRMTLTEENVESAVASIRESLLEADVDLNVARIFLERVKKRALGEVVQVEAKKGGRKLAASAGEHFVLICHHELEKLMGPIEEAPITFRRPYTIIMMVGLQGTGKTTSCAKLAQYLVRDGRRPMLVAADVYRPAAVDQLEQLGAKLQVPVYAVDGLMPPQVCQDALREAKRKKRDVVIIDTAGRLAIDDALMHELEDIKARIRPDHIFLVVDAMAGQDTVRTASEFNRRLDLTGFLMTKLDGDARGGAALSIKEVTGKPIKFLGMGEGLDKLEVFRPEGLASRILGMGDVVGLMKDFEAVVDEKEAERDTRKLLRGEFTLEDFLKQLKLLQKVGSVSEIFEKFPLFGQGGLPQGASIDDKTFVAMESLIHSMTVQERHNPNLIDEGRARRIAKGSGRKPEQVLDLVGRFRMMQSMMANLAAQPGLLGALPGFRDLAKVRQIKGMGMDDVMGDMNALPRGVRRVQMPMGPGAARMPGLPGLGFRGQSPMMPGLPGLPGSAAGMPSTMFPAQGSAALAPGALPNGMSAEDYAAMMQAGGRQPNTGPRVLSGKERQKLKTKRKAERQARKKSRRR